MIGKVDDIDGELKRDVGMENEKYTLFISKKYLCKLSL